ncbi:uncharacterized protein [Cherax quadricarinatus]|uniref:uncharacterized protein isoform X6 n=1 Tax=Cherax quadricarinatus TaxID=27406 RepID=UPI00387E31E6
MERRRLNLPCLFKVKLVVIGDGYHLASDGTQWMRTSHCRERETHRDTEASSLCSSRLKDVIDHHINSVNSGRHLRPQSTHLRPHARSHTSSLVTHSRTSSQVAHSRTSSLATHLRPHSHHADSVVLDVPPSQDRETTAAHAVPVSVGRPWAVRWEARVVVVEVTSLLLEALTRKLGTLQNELETSSNPATTEGSLKAKENLTSQLILTIEKVQNQWEQLEQEYTHQAIGVLRCSNTRGSGKSNRSQPAIGLKQTQKARGRVWWTLRRRWTSSSEPGGPGWWMLLPLQR